MNRSDSPKPGGKKLPEANKQTVDTAKALIEIYKSAFGERWTDIFQSTVRVSLG